MVSFFLFYLFFFIINDPTTIDLDGLIAESCYGGVEAEAKGATELVGLLKSMNWALSDEVEICYKDLQSRKMHAYVTYFSIALLIIVLLWRHGSPTTDSSKNEQEGLSSGIPL